MHNKPHLYIFDLDGTAIASNEHALPSDKLAQITSSYSDSVRFSVATGRSWLHAKNVIKKLKITTPCIISGGTQIIAPGSDKIIWQCSIRQTSLSHLIKIGQAYDKKMAYVDGTSTSEPLRAKELAHLKTANTVYMFGILEHELEQVLATINQEQDIKAVATNSWLDPSVIDLHITSANATKGHAVSKLLELTEIDRVDSTSIGDGYNDIDLIESTNTGIAMGNAEEELKQRACRVIDTVENDGLALFLEHELKTRRILKAY